MMSIFNKLTAAAPAKSDPDGELRADYRFAGGCSYLDLWQAPPESLGSPRTLTSRTEFLHWIGEDLVENRDVRMTDLLWLLGIPATLSLLAS
jgi:hypothetical protein